MKTYGEHTLTLTTGDEIMVWFERNGEPSDVYAYRDLDSDMARIGGLGPNPEGDPAFIYAEDAAYAWGMLKAYVLDDLEEEE